MRIKETIISMGLVLISCLLVFGAFKLENSFQPPKTKLVETSFEGGLVNNVGNDISIFPYGNVAFERSIIGDGVKLNNGHLSLQGSGKTKLRNAFTFSIWFNIFDTTPTDPMLLSRESTDGDVAQGPISIHFSDKYTFFRTDITFKMSNSEYQSYSY